MATFWTLLASTHWLLAIICVISVLRRRNEPMAMLAWIFAIMTIPLIGSILYGLIGSNRVKRKAGRRRKAVSDWIDRIERNAGHSAVAGGAEARPALGPELQTIEQLGQRLVQIPATSGNAVRVSCTADETYQLLEHAIRSARHHIHLQYYIWQPDETGAIFRDLLIEKAREGIECRVLLDAVGCLGLPNRFVQPMRDAGVKVAWFLPLYPFHTKRWSPHLRNHRKIGVIDGRVSFVGSQNIGDEYRGRLKRLSPWYDSHMRIEGPATLFLQQTFAEDWVFATREALTGDEYFPQPELRGDSVVQILPTGPDQDISVLTQILFAAVSTARSTVRIATPYFVPSAALRMALTYACYRGVKVQIVLPTRSDSPVVLWAGRSYYAEMVDAGIEVYEFDHGMLHSKIVTIDDCWALLGSANMDVRSFRLNFEVTAIVYDKHVTAQLSAEIERHRSAARLLQAREVWAKGMRPQLVEGAARLLAPLL